MKSPEAEIVPAVADHVTAGLFVARTVEVNCCFPPETIVVLDGEIAIVTRAEAVASATTSDNRLRPTFPLGSLTRTLKMDLPVVVGVPEITPVCLLSDNP